LSWNHRDEAFVRAVSAADKNKALAGIELLIGNW